VRPVSDCHDCRCHLSAPCNACVSCETCNPCWACDEDHDAPKNDECPKRRVRVYRRGHVWYGECSECPGEENRMRSAWLPYTHGKATRHVAKHRAEER
jgi:hypothetical protein